MAFSNVRSYYQHRWGEPDREAFFKKGAVGVSVLKWEARSATDDVTLYVTSGVSEHAPYGINSMHRQEFFVGLSPESDAFASPLAWLGMYASLEIRSVASGHLWRASNSVMNETGFNGFVLLAPQDGGLMTSIKLTDGRHVEFLMAVPVFTRELDIAATSGAYNLMTLMEDSQVAFWDPLRSPLPE